MEDYRNFKEIYTLKNELNEYKILGPNNTFIRQIESLFECVIVLSRGTVLIDNQIDGSDIVKYFEVLESLLNDNVHIGLIDLVNIYNCLKDGNIDELIKVYKSKEIFCTLQNGKAVYPKTISQAKYLHAFENSEIIFGVGPAGTGKTFLAVLFAARELKKQNVRKIVLVRPAVEAGEKLGFLPGDLKEKVDPYLIPLYDSLEDVFGKENVSRMIEKGIVEIAPLAYMRGRTLDNAIIILDEAQNTTLMQMKMFLTRLGFNSKMIITGDVTQIDLVNKRDSGLVEAIKLLKGIEGIKFVDFYKNDIMRNPLVYKIVNRYENKDN